MSFLNRLGTAIGTVGTRVNPVALHKGHSRGSTSSNVVSASAYRPQEMPPQTRISNGLKDLLWNLEGLGRGTLLDLGPAWQTTISFFIERGFRVTSEDVLHAWAEYLKEQEARARALLEMNEIPDRTPETLAKGFLQNNLQYAESSFDAVLLWDVLEYLEPTVARKVAARATDLLRPGGAILAMFHSKKPEGFQRYRVVDTSTLQVVSAKTILPLNRLYQTREVEDLFSRCHSIKSYVGRDQLREALLIK